MNIGFDIDSYVMGKKGGGENIVISGEITCADANNDGNVVISVNESEVNNNG